MNHISTSISKIPAGSPWFHAALAFLFTCIFIGRNANGMLQGQDGAYMDSLVRTQMTWMHLAPYLGPNLLQGMGNVYMGHNMLLVPAFMLPRWLVPEVSAVLIGHGLFALELFAATWLIGSVAGISRTIRLLGAWLLILLSLPFIWHPKFYPFFSLVPHSIDLLVYMAIAIVAYTKLGFAGSPGKNLGWLATFLLSMVMANLCLPVFTPIIVPYLFGMLALCSYPLRGNGTRWKAVSLAMTLGVLVASGIVSAQLGSILHSVPSLFRRDLHHGDPTLTVASIWYQTESFSSWGRWLLALSVAGAAAMAVRSRGLARRLALGHIAMTMVVVFGGWALVKLATGWRGPAMVYFEIPLWPMYCCYALALFEGPVIWARRRYARFAESAVLVGRYSAPIALVACSAVTMAYPRSTIRDYPYPPTETALVKTMRSEIGLRPGQAFRGIVATYAGGDRSKPLHWGDQHGPSKDLANATGNDHRMVGLWYFDIPTLFEYNQFMTPESYFVHTRLLTRPIDQQIRTAIAFTRFDANVLAAMGVRMVVADEDLPGNLPLRETMAVPALKQTLRLYDLPRTNVGNYAPSKLHRAKNVGEAMAIMKQGMDWEREAVVTDEIPGPVARPSVTLLEFERGGFRFRASADGRSVVVLPMQYSHCIDYEISGDARPFRVNLFQVGVAFSGKVDLRAQFKLGPLGPWNCRFKDYLEMTGLGIKEAGRRFPVPASTEAAR